MNSFLDWLLESTWQASVLIVLITVVQALSGRWLPARWRYALWLLVVLRLLLPSVSFPTQAMTVYRYLPERPEQAWQMTASALTPRAKNSASTTPAFEAIPAGSAKAPVVDFGLLAFAIWIGGVLGIITIQVGRHIVFHLRLRREHHVPMPKLERVLERCRRLMRVSNSIRLVVTTKVSTPAIHGLWRPSLLLPLDLVDTLSAQQLRLVFLHELAHVRRRDLLVNSVAGFAQIVHWFNPLVWLAMSRMSADRELAVDSLVIAVSRRRLEYGETLLQLTAGSTLLPFPRPALSILESKRDLRNRIQAIARWRRGTLAWSLLGVFLLIGIVFVTFGRKPISNRWNSLDVDSSFLDAIREERTVSIDLLVQSNPKTPPGLLTYAARNGSVETMRKLLAHGANPNEQDKDGRTPIDAAIQRGKLENASFLIAHGANISLRHDDGSNAAWDATFFTRSTDGLKFLIEKGVPLDGYDKYGNTLLLRSMRYVPRHAILADRKPATDQELRDSDRREREIIDVLAGAGLNLNQPAAPGTYLAMGTPLMAALQNGQYEIAKALLDHHVDIHATDKMGNNALSCALSGWGWDQPLPIDIIDRLLKQGADPNSTYAYPWSKPLPPPTSVLKQAMREAVFDDGPRLAAAREAVKLLLANGAKFKPPLDQKDTAIFIAAAGGDLKALEAAVAAGGSVNARDGEGWTPLMVSLAMNYLDCADWLLAQGASPKPVAIRENSALWIAVMRQKEAMVRSFLAAGANPNRNKPFELQNEFSCLQAAIYRKNLPIMQMLLDAGAKTKSVDLYDSIHDGQIEMVRILLEHGADPEGENFENRRNVFWAVEYHQPEILKMLLDRGANPELETMYHETPLEMAEQSKNPACVDLLRAAIERRHTQAK